MSGPLGSQQWMYASGGFYDHTIDNSLRFNDDDSAYLSRTPASAGNRRTWTWSGWVKRGNLNANTVGNIPTLFAAQDSSPGLYNVIILLNSVGNDVIYAQLCSTPANSAYILETSQTFRDVAGWYHIVWAVDTTQATASDRAKLYVNGEQVTSFATEQYPPQNTDTDMNNTVEHQIGKWPDYTRYFDGYMADVNFIDGQALDPTSFGELKSGIWIPKDTSGLTFGTNGFHLPFAGDIAAGSSYYFDGNNDSVVYSHSTLYDVGSSDDFELECFFNTDMVSGSGDYGYVLGNYDGSSQFMTLQFDFRTANKKFSWYTGNGASWSWQYTSGDVSPNTWHHITISRTSGTIRAFLDGTRLTSLSGNGSPNGTASGGNVTGNTTSYNLSSFRIGESYAGQKEYKGYLSNVRFIVGSSIRNSDSSFTVPTATLTDVTNTKLLTATNLTIGDDISSNNNDGTANNQARASGVNPFGEYDFFEDVSGNGNNWSPNNLQYTDVVPDSPTNNFCTWNALDKYNYNAPSEGNLRALTAGNNGTQASTFAVSSGKWYFEVRNGSAGSGTLARFVGIGKEDTNIQTIPYNNADCYLYYSINGNSYNGGTQVAYGDSWQADGDIIGVAFDADNGAIWFSKNGTWQNSATAAEIAAGTTTNAAFTGLSGTFVMMVSKTGGTSSNDPHDANFGQDSTFAGLIAAGGNSDANGYGDFAYAPPTDFLALCSANLPTGAINTAADETPEDYFNTVLYSGDSSASNAITGVGFQPDLVWIKERNGTFNHVLQDVIRGSGASSYNFLATDNTDAETSQTDGDGLLSLDTDGFTVGFFNTGAWNETGSNYASWNWKAGGTGVSNTDGSITSTVSVGATSQQNWFSIASYTGNATAGATIGHGLGVAPDMIIVKSRDNARDWRVYHSSLGSAYTLDLNTALAVQGPNSAYWNSTDPTSSVFSVGSVTTVNGSGEDYIAYCFANAEGLCKVGSYVGQSFIYTGFRPAFVMIKKYSGGTFTSGQSDWIMYDSTRDTYNPSYLELLPNSTQAENTYASGGEDIDILSNGFKIVTSSSQIVGTSTYQYIYLAIAEQPFKYANAR